MSFQNGRLLLAYSLLFCICIPSRLVIGCNLKVNNSTITDKETVYVEKNELTYQLKIEKNREGKCDKEIEFCRLSIHCSDTSIDGQSNFYYNWSYMIFEFKNCPYLFHIATYLTLRPNDGAMDLNFFHLSDKTNKAQFPLATIKIESVLANNSEISSSDCDFQRKVEFIFGSKPKLPSRLYLLKETRVFLDVFLKVQDPKSVEIAGKVALYTFCGLVVLTIVSLIGILVVSYRIKKKRKELKLNEVEQTSSFPVTIIGKPSEVINHYNIRESFDSLNYRNYSIDENSLNVQHQSKIYESIQSVDKHGTATQKEIYQNV